MNLTITASPYDVFNVRNVATLLWQRTLKAFATFPTKRGWVETALLVLAVMIPGYMLSVAGDWYSRPPREFGMPWVWAFTGAFVAPALIEELITRVWLVPHPSENTTKRWRYWVIFGALVFYVVIHPINGLIQGGFMGELFTRADYIFLVTILGIACHISYQRTGSIWAPTMIHALVVTAWIIMRG